jgi:hypothetical protein
VKITTPVFFILKILSMNKNMGSFDRITRTIIAAAIAILYFTHVITGTLGVVLLIIGVVFLLTSFMGTCPLYLPFGINTCKKKKP